MPCTSHFSELYSKTYRHCVSINKDESVDKALEEILHHQQQTENEEEEEEVKKNNNLKAAAKGGLKKAKEKEQEKVWKMRLTADHGNEASRLVQILQAIPKVGGKLENLNYRCAITGQFSLFSDALIETASDSLKTLYIYCGTGVSDDDDDNRMCPTHDNLVQFADTVLPFLPNLEVLAVQFHKTPPQHPLPVAGTSHERLTAWRVALPAMIRPNNHLTTIYIDDELPTISLQATKDIGRFLRACNDKDCLPNLETLEVCDFKGAAPVDEKEHLPLVSQLLLETEEEDATTTTNNKLSIIQFACSTIRLGLVKVLKTNRTLTSLEIGTGPPKRYIRMRTPVYDVYDYHLEEAKAFHDLLRHHNFTIANLNIHPWNVKSSRFGTDYSPNDFIGEMKHHVDAIRFFLRLNWDGRSEVMGRKQRQEQRSTTTTADHPTEGANHSKEKWVQLMGKWTEPSWHKTEETILSGVFYYLQQNPSLCNGDTGLHHQQPPFLLVGGDNKATTTTIGEDNPSTSTSSCSNNSTSTSNIKYWETRTFRQLIADMKAAAEKAKAEKEAALEKARAERRAAAEKAKAKKKPASKKRPRDYDTD